MMGITTVLPRRGMAGWTILLTVIAAAALAAVVAGVLWDRRATRRRRRALTAPPAREVPGFAGEKIVPEYLSELEARRPAEVRTPLPTEQRQALADKLAKAMSIPAGWASEVFVTEPEPGWAVLRDPVVLVCGDPVTWLRELYPVLEQVMPRQVSLVLVASEVSAEVMDALEVNYLRGNLTTVVVLAPAGQLDLAAEFVGGALVPRVDLAAGYLPPEVLGHCSWWISDSSQSWVLGTDQA